MTLDELNALPAATAEARLLACCGSRAWARGMAARRPFADHAALFAAGDEVWHAVSSDGWLEAFRAHPRIGEQAPAIGERAPAGGERAARWAAQEQAGVRADDHALRDALVAANRAYEERFGFLFIICATGRTGEEMLTALRARLEHDAATELRVAAEEQRKITHLRLEKLLSP